MMSTNVSSDVVYVIKQLDEIRDDNHKRKHNFSIQYNDNEKIDGNNQLSKNDTQSRPTVEVENVDENTYRTLIMVDPDAPSRDDAVKGPALHWILANFQNKDLKDGQTLYPYKPPGPGAGTGPHRYIFLLYQSIEKILENKIENDQRLRFPLQKYVLDNQLGLLDATYFTIDG